MTRVEVDNYMLTITGEILRPRKSPHNFNTELLPQIPMKNVHIYILASIILFIGCKDEETVTPPQRIPTETFLSTASFRLVGDGYNNSYEYDSDQNLIFCHRYDDELWIRLASEKTNNGENGPHIDIDVCNFTGSGTYKPMDPLIRPCGLGQVWDIWWHDDPKIYVNQASSAPCELIIKIEGSIIKGTFSCKDVILFEGSPTIDIEEGHFECPIEIK